MKLLLNWRYYAIVALMAIGMAGVMCAVGDDAEPITEAAWQLRMLGFVSVAAISFYTLARLARRWQRDGKIPEFTDPEIP